MRKIVLTALLVVLLLPFEVYSQGCAAIYAKKISINQGVRDTVDFSANELNNGIQMQCGQTYLLGAETFAPGGSSSYVFEQIPYEPPVPFNLGGTVASYAGQLCNSDDTWGSLFSLNYGHPPQPGIPDFTFDFYGQTYQYAVVGANGLISFDINNPNCVTPPGANCKHCQYTQEQSGPIPNPSRYKNCIMAPYYDIIFTSAGDVYFDVIGEYPCRKMVLSFYQVPMFSCTSLIATHMVVLYETTNVIEFYLQNKPICTGWQSGKATLGIHNADGTQACTITNASGQSYNNSVWGAQNEAWRIKPSGQLDNYGVEWKKRAAFDYSAPMVEVAADMDGVVTVDVTAQEGPTRFFCKNTIVRDDGNEFEVWDSTAVYYPIDMPDIVISHNENVEYKDTVCSGGIVNFAISGGGDNGKYYQMSPRNADADTLTVLGATFNRANNPAVDEVKYIFKIENYDDFGTLVCTRYDSCVIVNRSFNVELQEDFTICKGTEITLTDILKEHEGVSSWSTGATGDTLVYAPEHTETITLTKTDNLGCTASDEIVVTVNDSPEVTITGTMDICEGTSTRLTANSTPGGCTFEWDNGSTEQSILVTPATDQTYTVSVKLPPAMCETIESATVIVRPLPQVMCSEDKLICEGESAEISVNGDATRWVWETTDPAVNGANATNFVVSPSATTLYKVHGYNDINCHSQDEVKVTVEPKPTPYIRLNPSVLDALDPTIIITDGSTGNDSRQWRLSDGYTSTNESFVHTFELTDTSMRFDISLVAVSPAGCTDSISTFVRVKRDHYLWAPTGIYLHDNNPANREFRLWIDNIVSYNLEIFNRNGERVFQTDDIEKAWDCTYKGSTVMQGVYVWKVVYRHNDAPNKEESQTGTFMIYN